MKRIIPLDVDDTALLVEFANRKSLSSHPHLLGELRSILYQYKVYGKERGNVLKLKSLDSVNKTLADALRTHYTSKISGLEFIEKIRNDLSPEVCPMCGGLGTSEVDHVAPKDEYPEFAFLSLNLVPACSCNNKKSTKYRDFDNFARVLHPYFDDYLINRIVYLRYQGEIETPRIEISPMVGYYSDNNLAFHIDTILRKSMLKTWKIKTWSNFYRNPLAFLGGLKAVPGEINCQHIQEFAAQSVLNSDEIYGTKNNWYSMMFYGLSINREFTRGLAERVNILRSGKVVE